MQFFKKTLEKLVEKISTSKHIFALVVVASVTAILLGVYWTISYTRAQTGSTRESIASFSEGEALAEKDEDRYSAVFLGRGGDGHAGGTLTDSIIVLTANIKEKKATLISVPRDLWVPVFSDWEETSNFKINAAYNVGLDNVRYANKKPEFRGEKGAGRLVGVTVETVTGLPIDYFIVIDFEKYKELIDTLGGVDIDVPKTFDDYFYPIKGLENETCGMTAEEISEAHLMYSGFELEKRFACRWEHLHFDKGPAKLDGETALKFVRSRHGDSDFGRSERQFAVLAGISKKLISLDAVKKGSNLIKDIHSLVHTDMSLSAIGTLLDILGNPEEYSVNEVHITEDNLVSSSKSQDGQYILLPKAGLNNFEEIKAYIKEGL